MDDFDDIEKSENPIEVIDYVDDIREYDVPYHVRVSIDKEIRVGKWYTVESNSGLITLTELTDRLARADPVILAFDIETSKAPLKFPDAAIDQIMMISYMIDGEGFLITNREIISKDIEDFEYTPRPEYPGCFTIFNESDEKAVLQRFFEHIQDVKPTIIATYNGDFFDWPFVEKRASINGLDMYEEIGFQIDSEGEYKSNYCVHMDCFRWVKRDSYLPQGSQGLKAVTTAKLGYNPIELDPELMTPYAYEKPQTLSEYSVSDAVATYYLYYKYVHPFIFSLCTILPLNPDDVLRKGTGTLCEMLLMVQAYRGDILLPNKHMDPIERFYDGHLIESETYVGGHVESLEAGVFRSDLATDFKIDPTAIDELLADLDKSLKFTVEIENNKKFEDVENYEEVRDQIKESLLALKNSPKRFETPLIYHLDVASMYPNIMITNRLQPDSMKSEEDCASCDFNRPNKVCDRRLPWSWRVDYNPSKKDEYNMIRRALQLETFTPKKPWLPRRSFDDLSHTEQVQHIRKRLNDYSRKVYHKVKKTEIKEREAIICQRENSFYIDTVRDFRDRRYDFKGLAKVWKKKASQVSKDDHHGLDEAKKMIVLYDSLQLAHKVILNSFYGYVMRKGSRWYSMEMAGITCLTGATIIQIARSLVERLGRPLELDTDGIWCILPKSFPENYVFKLKGGGKVFVSYPCVMLNYLVHDKFTNHQYQTLADAAKHKYKTSSENSIFFEVDGPYKAMILPTSKEEGKGLKKRYAVFNDDGSLAELKGFELKRRGELQLVKNFQSDLFGCFLLGNTLEECYGEVAKVANSWLDVLTTKGSVVSNDELIELISENRMMSKSLEEYGGQKSTSITTAKRLGEFLGNQMTKDKGLACKYIISQRPVGAPVTERAVPVAIFSSEEDVKKLYLRRWLVDPQLNDFDIKSILDWDYYLERLGSVVQKIITIPAALQHVKNPVPRVAHPDWLAKRIRDSNNRLKQKDLGTFFKKAEEPLEIENCLNRPTTISNITRKVAKVTVRGQKRKAKENEEENEELTVIDETTPLMEEDYKGWLRSQKRSWKRSIKLNTSKKFLFGSNFDNSNTIGNMFRNQAASFASSSWEILQYAETNTPGEVRLQALINGKIHNFKLKVPKKVIVSFGTEELPPDSVIPNTSIEKLTNFTLPNGHTSKHLFRMTMPEEQYLKEMTNAQSVLFHQSVNGIYETKIKGAERALLELGTSCVFDESRPGGLGRGIENGFDLTSLKSVENERYLQTARFDYIYLLHLNIPNIQHEVFALFRTWSEKAQIFVKRPSRMAQPLAPMETFYHELFIKKLSKLEKTISVIEYSEKLEFEIIYYDDLKKLYNTLGTSTRKAHEEKNTQSILVLQAPSPQKLAKIVKVPSELPIIKLQSMDVSVPTLGWQAPVSKRIIGYFLSLGSWISHLKILSRYSNIPICNLQGTDVRFLIDVIYARKLQRANVVLWWSPEPMPDHGGFEKEEGYNNSSLQLQFPIINNPGLYRTASLELSVRNLSINTVLTSALINEAEGSDLADLSISIGDGQNPMSFSEDSFSSVALSVLRQMLKGWWDEAIKEKSNAFMADTMVHNFVSWVQKPDSHLYDSALHYHVNNLSRKAFLQLTGEFKKMGSRIIYGDQNRLILQTSKTSVENSYAYGQYISKAIRSKPLFHFLDVSVTEYYDTLLWMDNQNFGGRCCKEITTDNPPLVSKMNWHIRSFLPSILQSEFNDWINIFLDAILEEKSRILSETTPRATQLPPSLGKKQTTLKVGNENELSVDEELTQNGKCIENIKKPLIKRVQQLIRKQTTAMIQPELRQEFQFPNLPGSHLNLKNPTLQLVKSICAVYGLDKKMNLSVRVLRRELLRHFDIREFSEEAEFKNPSQSLRLSEVICEYCGHVGEIDLCSVNDIDDDKLIWGCEDCKKPCNKIFIEERLIYELDKICYSYHSQDFKCNKCNKVRADDLSDYCPCSGGWIETVPKEEIFQKIKLLKHVSEWYDMKLLDDMISELI